jgi:uncharacterized membrane protein
MTVSHDRDRPRSSFARRTRHLRQHPRLLISSLLGVAIYLVLPAAFGQGTRLLAAFDLAAIGFLAAMWIMMARASTADMRRRAQFEDEGRHLVLALSAAVGAAILLAITYELHGIRGLPPGDAGIRVALAGVTILLAWFFTNTMFALHYAHSFYGDSDSPADAEARGLAFPGRTDPDYWDFLYFSFTIGMTFQVSDVQIENHRLRRIGLAHGVLAFFFNVVVLALTINIIAGLI